jgi:FecR protein
MDSVRAARGRYLLWAMPGVLLAVLLLSARQVPADEQNPPARVARISYLSGKVSLEPAGVDQWSEASLNYPMTINDRLYTDQGAKAELDVGSAAVRLWESTDLTVANLTDQFMQLGLAQGSIRLSVYDLPSGNSIEVDTPNGALTIQQQGLYRVDTFPSDNTTLVSVYSGSVQLSGGGLNQTVQSAQAVKLMGTGPIEVTYVSLPQPDSFDEWSASRDRLYASSSPYVSRDIPGYYALSGYGVWSEVPSYGPVWYPSAVPAGWVPYTYGHWVWVSPWGWTWVDDYPWGFAPFHYGRWAYIGVRWGWVPGPVVVNPYYAPALVAFVGGPGFGVGIGVGAASFVGWFPLGPREPFYPWYHAGPTYLREVNVTNIRNYTFVNVTNVRNIHYMNERVGTTAVRANVFSSGGLVRNAMVRVSPAQLARAQVIPHPSINPRQSAVLAGRPVAAPVPTARLTSAAARQRLASVRPLQPPVNARGNQRLVTRVPPPNRSYQAPRTQATRTFAPGPAARNYPSTTRPRLITRSAPPPRSVPFSTKLKAMQSHPGRPLEPQQVNNLRAGRPAGSMRDREYIPHPSSSNRQTQKAPSKKSAPSKSEGKSENKRH